jgi:catechol 2,3-dioxygenase-like lactoylglutathione lyase family enzyme
MRMPIALALAVACLMGFGAATGQSRPLVQGKQSPPGFHHLHLNSVNPAAAIAFYTKYFPSTEAATFAGQPALRSPNDVWVLFTKVDHPPATQPPTAFWHFGWHVADVRARLDAFKRDGASLLPLYTGDGTTVSVSSDTWPGAGGVLGLTVEGIRAAKAAGVTPRGGAGFAYLRGPDDALVEYQGNMPAGRFNHVHMFHDQPYCAQLWYERHLNVPPPARASQPPRDASNCAVERSPERTFPALDAQGMFRTPSVTHVRFGDVSFFWYMNQGDAPAAPSRGHLMDHVGLSVTGLDEWVARLRAANVTFLQPPYTVGDWRAVMIEGPSREAIELIESSPSRAAVYSRSATIGSTRLTRWAGQ